MEDRQASRYGFNGKEFISDGRLDLYDFGERLYEPTVGRWTAVDPLSDHQKQLDKSPYAAMWNNPIRYNDPDGRCPECDENVKDPTDDQSYTSTGGAEYIFGNGELTRQGGTRDEVVVTDSRNGESDFGRNSPSLGDIGTIPSLAGEGMWLLGESRSTSLYQQGFRRGLSGNYQLTGRNRSLFVNQPMTSATKPLTGLTNFGKGLSNFGTGLTVAGMVIDTYQYSQGELSGARYGYHLTGTGASIGAAYFLGGPYGAAVGGLFFLGEKAWNMTQPMRDEISRHYRLFENALRSGWKPR
ncbi:RHS repeat-associated core domain-containing protein [Cyclobacterium xiamenense]|uniref:RHS repeat-associated core domain-containing protein n=1 Tax=Cyclobacterium xiamenense TaxID=1297121 RepID=UPI0035CF7F21